MNQSTKQLQNDLIPEKTNGTMNTQSFINHLIQEKFKHLRNCSQENLMFAVQKIQTSNSIFSNFQPNQNKFQASSNLEPQFQFMIENADTNSMLNFFICITYLINQKEAIVTKYNQTKQLLQGAKKINKLTNEGNKKQYIKYSEKQIFSLKTFFNIWPYPDNQQMDFIANEMNTTTSRIENWFKHNRRHLSQSGKFSVKNRKHFNESEIRCLNEYYNKDKKPDQDTFIQLAKNLKCSALQIKNWFSNKRKKENKIQKKQLFSDEELTIQNRLQNLKQLEYMPVQYSSDLSRTGISRKNSKNNLIVDQKSDPIQKLEIPKPILKTQNEMNYSTIVNTNIQNHHLLKIIKNANPENLNILPSPKNLNFLNIQQGGDKNIKQNHPFFNLQLNFMDIAKQRMKLSHLLENYY